jgi:DHA2 family multidrug resistance protein
LLVGWELRHDEPIINFRLFRNVPLTVGSSIGSLVGFALFGSSFLLPQYTQDLMNYPAYQAGLVLMPRALAMMLAMPIVGRLYNFVSPRVLVGFGIMLLTIAYWKLSHFTMSVSFWSFAPILIMSGVGMGASMVTTSTVTLNTIPRALMTSASSLTTLMRRIAGNVAYAALATVVARRTQFHRSMLVDSITVTNPVFQTTDNGYRGFLSSNGLQSAPGQRRDIAMLNSMINGQSTMMAYNDCFWLLVPLLLVSLPLIFLLPNRGVPDDSEGAAGAH